MEGFSADDLIECYRRGVFPMADARHDTQVFLVEPARRGVIPLGGFHVARRLARTLRSGRFQVRIDHAFEAVIEAHSVEAWSGDRLVGGLYGIALGGAFFGESMFSVERDASKVALAHLVARLIVGGFTLLDTQFLTEHLATFGTEEISRAEYGRRLQAALRLEGDFGQLDPYAGGGAVMQAISQAS